VNCLSGLKLTPLHLACQGDHDDVVDLLIQNGANKSAPDEAGILPGEFTKSSQVKTLLLQGQ
jgi:ankyrin repeat protein